MTPYTYTSKMERDNFMYQSIETVEDDFHSTDERKYILTKSIMEYFFDSDTKARSAIRKNVNMVPEQLYPAYIQCVNLNREDIETTLSNKEFSNYYHKARYVFAILNRYTSNAEPACSFDLFD